MRVMAMSARRIGMRAAFAALLAILTCGISQAGAAVTIEREVPVNSSNPYTPVADGSVWTTYATSANGGTVLHLDGQNGSILASFFISISSYNPQAIGYANNRVYIAQPGRIDSLLVNGPSGTTNPGLVGADGETASRLCCNQIFLRVGPDGTGNVALGQSNKVAILDLNNLTEPLLPAVVLRSRDQHQRQLVRGLRHRCSGNRPAGLRGLRRRWSGGRPAGLRDGHGTRRRRRVLRHGVRRPHGDSRRPHDRRRDGRRMC